jgi:hypothetical protein
MNAFITWFDQEFKRLEDDWRELIGKLDGGNLYSRTAPASSTSAEQIVRSARIVEQTFGGITVNLWDDPFEWTLPETLTTPEKLLAYLDEVRDARARGFELFKSDEELLKTIMTPSGPTQVISLLLDTLVRAGQYQLRAKDAFGKTS